MARRTESRSPATARPFKLLRPPIKVWIDLAILYPLPPHHRCTFNPEGFDVRRVVPGDLLEWSITVDGDWLGRVSYELMSRDRSETVTHWVSSRALVPL